MTNQETCFMNILKQEKNTLVEWLHTAMTIELSTIPPYMMALISIKPGKNRVAANLIRGVMMEEMLHLSLAGNILSAIDGKAQFNEKNIPSYPLALRFEGKHFRHREFDVNIGPFSPENTQIFTEIELPEGPTLKAIPELDVSGYTIGEFYDQIEKKLTELCDKYGEKNVFSGNPEHQLNMNYYWAGGGVPIVITGLAEAKEAIQLIVTQGEGVRLAVYDKDHDYFGQPEEVAHFFRFREIQFARHYRLGDDPKKPPTGEAFEVDYHEVFPIITNPKAADYANDPVMAQMNNEFNRFYSLMLHQIAEALNGASGAMYTAILNSMHSMTAVALKMVATPIANDPKGQHGTPTFEWVEPV
jgi:Ferritin-like